MLRGFTTISYWADDVRAAADWYAQLLGSEPYFRTDGPDGEPAYIEFRIGDYQHELGLISRAYAPPQTPTGPGGAVMYWHVDDVEAALARLCSLGATEHQPVTVRGDGFITASVIDPFGNLLGVMFNQHYLDILGQRPATPAT